MNIIFCLPGKSFSDNFLSSWSNTLAHMINSGHSIRISLAYDSNVYFVRQKCLGANVLEGKHQHPFGLHKPDLTSEQLKTMDYDYLMWIDSDIVWDYSQILKLISNDKSICSGLYLMENGECFATVENWDAEHYKQHGMYQFLKPSDLDSKPSLFNVAYTGFGFMLIKKGVFESLDYPWFRPRKFKFTETIEDFCSEDIGFCLLAKEKGHDIFVDKSVIVGHEKSLIVGGNLYSESVKALRDKK